MCITYSFSGVSELFLCYILMYAKNYINIPKKELQPTIQSVPSGKMIGYHFQHNGHHQSTKLTKMTF